MDYVIEEVFEILCDIDKILTFKFRLESDGEDQYREILDSYYFEWCYEKYISEEGNNYENDYESYIEGNFIDILNITDSLKNSDLEIGRAHVRTPVTSLSRMPSSA